MIIRISTWLTGIFLFGCAQSYSPTPMMLHAEIINRISLPQVPSASGIVVENGHAWILGDDSPWLFQLDLQGNIIAKYPIGPMDTANDGRIPKPIKPDFEMLERVPESRLVLCMGSGSKRETRSAVTLWHTEKHETTLSGHFPGFMDILAGMLQGENPELNLEGAAFWKSDLILLNRYPRTLFRMDWAATQQYWLGRKGLPAITATHFPNDPAIPFPPGFSGLTYFPQCASLLFCASTEETSNAYDDGAIGTSYLGLIQLDSDSSPTESMVPILENDHPIAIKVESVSIGKAIGPNQWQIWAVTDADGGPSELLEIWIRFQH